MVRTGHDYLNSLKESSLKIWYKGEKVHPLQIEKLKHQASVLADYYQHHHQDPENIVTSANGSHSVTLMMPRNHQDLTKKAKGFYSLAKNYLGVLGRPPDYINSVFSCWAGCSDLFKNYSGNVDAYYQQMIKHDYFVTHSTSELKGGHQSGIRVVAEKENGVILSGARSLATAAALCDEIFIAPTRVSDNEIEKAIVCSIPANSEGLNLICRSNFESGSDLSRYYDESDALITLDRVFVPWERVFIYRDLDLYKSIVKATGTSLAASLQTNARAIAKLEMLIELLLEWKNIYPKYHSNNFAQTAGNALRDLQILKALQKQAIENGRMVHSCMQADGESIEAAKIYFMESYPRIIASLRQDMAPDLFYLFEPTEIDGSITSELCSQWGISEQTFQDRQKVSKLLFDLLISTFGVRHEVYEQYYAGNPKNGVANYWNNYSGKHGSSHIFGKLQAVDHIYEENFVGLPPDLMQPFARPAEKRPVADFTF